MKYKYLLRIATSADAIMIAGVYLAARKKFVSFAPLIHSDDSIYKWILEKLIPTDQLIVAVEGESIIGMMALSKNEGIGWIDQLYISPVAVGHGVGTLLVTKAKSTLGSPVRLHTFQENVRARRFYE
jgi:GNAT superfamily N-acetyltransferase